MENILNKSLVAVASDFRENELAYLALTTKIEHPIRDRWAFRLHEMSSGKFIVSREWKRTDLALLEDTAPRALIELKAMYTFDAALDKNGISGFTQAMRADELKAAKLANERTQIYTVLLATHPKSIIPEDLEGVVKYRHGINKALRRYGSAESVLKEAAGAIENKFIGKNVVSLGCFTAGKAFGIETDVLFWSIKA